MKTTPKQPSNGKGDTIVAKIGDKPVMSKRIANTPKISESQLQQSFFKWFRLQYPQYYWNAFAIPNGGLRNKQVAAQLKREGVVSGVWDVFILNNKGNNNSRGLWVEFKVKPNKLTDNQIAFQKENFYYDFAVCYTIEEAVIAVNNYLNY